jgi:hypothetical protein
MEQSLFIITIISLVMVIVLMGTVLYLGYKLLKAKMANEDTKTQGTQYQIHDEVLKRLQELNLSQTSSIEKKNFENDLSLKHIPATEQYFCDHHPQEMSVGTCDICEKAFCSHCLKNHKNLHFCPEHLQLFLMSQWSQVVSVKTSADEPKSGVYLYNLKQELWKEEIPTYMETQYKINIDNDHIESFVALFSRDKDLSFIKTKLKN